MLAEDIEKKMIDDAKKRGDRIVKEAKDTAAQIHSASLEYVEDMLEEVNDISYWAKDNMRALMEAMLEEFDKRIKKVEQDKMQLLEQLREVRNEEHSSVRKKNYRIRTEQGAIQKQTVIKQPYEIKIAEEWRPRIEQMLEEREDYLHKAEYHKMEKNKSDPPKPPMIEEEEGYRASDFNLDDEYFNWLDEKKE